MDKKPKDLLRSLTTLTSWYFVFIFGTFSNLNNIASNSFDIGFSRMLVYCLFYATFLFFIDYFISRKAFFLCAFLAPALFALNIWVTTQIIFSAVLYLPAIFLPYFLVETLAKVSKRNLVLSIILVLTLISSVIALPKAISDSSRVSYIYGGKYSQKYTVPIETDKSLSAREKIMKISSLPSICNDIFSEPTKESCILEEKRVKFYRMSRFLKSLPSRDEEVTKAFCDNYWSYPYACEQEILINSY